MSTEEVSPEEIENTRMLSARNETEILRAVAHVTQAHAAACMGVSPSTVSRALEDLPRWAQLLASVGLRVAPTDSIVVSQHKLAALEDMALEYLEARRQERIRNGRE
ncbi:MarR family transcriptional regulator [Paraburkholderia sp. J12]|uniref:MarR family transcriptional regulator n=1 Tax=Paraburkholderia sp. J12 TaxID=2805432 RepID=UPI002ABDBA4C|nr:MarR family transcriptional regulator [Paraburkholderia sp. J12]